MKILVFLFVAVLTISFVTSANHNRRHGRKSTRTNEESDPEAGTDVEWPHPGAINDFTVPEEFTGGSGVEDGHDSEDEIPPARQHGKNHNKSHKN